MIFIEYSFSHPTNFSKAWIGLRKEDKAYYWVDGSDSVYHNWKEEHYTENQRDSDTCVLVNEDGKWELERCEDKNYFVCKQKMRKYTQKIVKVHFVSLCEIRQDHKLV